MNSSYLVGIILYFALIILLIVSLWKVFVKAGKPGWASIIPIYNLIVMIQIAKRPMWYIALMFVPIANIYAICSINNGISNSFGKGTGFTIGLILLPFIFLPILAFSDVKYSV